MCNGPRKMFKIYEKTGGGDAKETHSGNVWCICGIEYRMVLSMILLIKNGCGYIGNAS